jgi:nitrate reductase (NAD(P)H)
LNFRQILQKFDQITAPITLVCAGNRRKEQNTVRKSKGFSWGPAGLSTALFTGPLMADVLRYAKPLRQAKYVCMEGADKLPNGYYGTSVKLNWAMDPNKLIMLAHKMNGEPLRPDHGRPLRAVVPGQIGGRSVKWIKKLILTDAPSDNWYHIYDNRVLP